MIALLPAIWTGYLLLRGSWSWEASSSGALCLACVLFLMATLARARGKATEARLRVLWGDWPTTIMLRHRDLHIDKVTKVRYHEKLVAVTSGKALPLPHQETADESAADEAYRSVTKAFLEHRRGPQYQLIQDENAWYGFRRNLRGLKWPAVWLAAILCIATAGIWLKQTQPLLVDLFARILAAPLWPAVAGADLLFALCLATIFTDNFVWQAGVEYAEALFRSLDAPQN